MSDNSPKQKDFEDILRMADAGEQIETYAKFGPAALLAHPDTEALGKAKLRRNMGELSVPIPASEEPEADIKPDEHDDEPVTDQMLSIKEIKVALNKSPQLLDELLAREFNRPEGPRTGALRAFYAAETGGDGRPDVIDRLEKALGI